MASTNAQEQTQNDTFMFIDFDDCAG